MVILVLSSSAAPGCLVTFASSGTILFIFIFYFHVYGCFAWCMSVHVHAYYSRRPEEGTGFPLEFTDTCEQLYGC